MTNTTERPYYRGYIVSRSVSGVAYPQRIQNLVIRDYAARLGLRLALSLTEYAMPRCYMMLEDLVNRLDVLEGIVFFSIFTLMPDPKLRALIYRKTLDAMATLHFALESLTLRSAGDVEPLEDILAVATTLGSAPFAGRYSKASRDTGSRSPSFSSFLQNSAISSRRIVTPD